MSTLLEEEFPDIGKTGETPIVPGETPMPLAGNGHDPEPATNGQLAPNTLDMSRQLYELCSAATTSPTRPA
jgi:hypothetical protein